MRAREVKRRKTITRSEKNAPVESIELRDVKKCAYGIESVLIPSPKEIIGYNSATMRPSRRPIPIENDTNIKKRTRCSFIKYFRGGRYGGREKSICNLSSKMV